MISNSLFLATFCVFFLAACVTKEEAKEPLHSTTESVVRGHLTIDSADLEIVDTSLRLQIDVHNRGKEPVAINSFWWYLSSFHGNDIKNGIDDSSIGNLMFFTSDTTAGYMSTKILIPPKQSLLYFEVVEPNEIKHLSINLPLSTQLDDIVDSTGYVYVSMPYWNKPSVPNGMRSSSMTWASENRGVSASEVDIYMRGGIAVDDGEIQHLVMSLSGRATYRIRLDR